MLSHQSIRRMRSRDWSDEPVRPVRRVAVEAGSYAVCGFESRPRRRGGPLRRCHRRCVRLSEGTAEFRARLSITELPPIDVKATSSAISAFRAGYSRYGSKAFQQQPAAKLVDVAKDQTARSTRWATARWQGLFDVYQSLMKRTVRPASRRLHAPLRGRRTSREDVDATAPRSRRRRSQGHCRTVQGTRVRHGSSNSSSSVTN